MPWIAGLLALNPGAGQVLVDSGALRRRRHYQVRVLISASVGMEAVFERRDSAGATLQSKIIPCTLSFMSVELGSIYADEGDRLVVITRAAVAGEVEASLCIE